MVEAAYLGDRPDVASGLLSSTATNSWMNMIAQGAGATMEAWTPAEKPNLTYSHPWAASPAFTIPQGMFGINPTAPGYDTFDIKPQPGTVTWGHITSPTVKGEIGAAFDTVGSRVDVSAYVPANATARVFVPDAAPDGPAVIYEDGSLIPGTVTNAYFEADKVQPGCHVFSTAPGAAPGHDTELTSVCPLPYSFPAAAEQLDHLKGYVATLPIAGGIRNALTTKLDNAASLYADGRNRQAVSMLNAFINQVNSLRDDGVLTADESQNLLGAAATVISTHPTS
jgi:hypothetical protein